MKSKYFLFIRVTVVFFLIITSTLSKTQDFQFKTYSFNNGLSSYNAGKILQDKFGFIWIGTQEGINRFDGETFITVKKDPLHNAGLSENYITDIALDDEGKLWIASALGGVDKLNPENLKIETRLKEDTLTKNKLITNWVRSIAWSPQKELWIGTYFGLSVFDKTKNSFFSIPENPFNTGDFNINLIWLDPLNNMWVSVENEGILIFNTISKKITSKISKTDFGISSNENFVVNSMFINRADDIYLCTNDGIKRISIKNLNYRPVLQDDHDDLNIFKKISVRVILKDEKERLWIGTQNGVFVIDSIGETKRILHSNFFYNTLLDDNVNNLYKDAFGNIWITTTKGLNLLINGEFHFQAYKSKSGILSQVKHVNTLYPQNDSIIFACASTGLFEINITNFSTNCILKAEDYGEVESIVEVNQNSFLVSTHQKVLLVKKTGSSYTSHVASNFFKELSPLQNNLFSTMLKLNDSIILMGSMEEEGLIKWNFKHNSIKQFKSNTENHNGIYENNIHNIKRDRSGNIWLLNNLSISKFNPKNNLFTNYFPTIKTPETSMPHFFFDLYDDGKYLWITSYGNGLIRFDIENNQFISFTEKDGFSSNALYNILNENDSTLWISSNKGLTRFNYYTNEASKYFVSDGLQSDAFDERSACKIKNYLFFGGIDGFTMISKNVSINSSLSIPAYVGRITYTDNTGNLNEINALNINDTVLRFKSTPITFHIISPDYNNRNRIFYAYKVNELSEQWIKLGENNEVTLAGLSPGTYHFKGMVYNVGGNTHESKSLKFIIIPEWYQTILFKFTILLTGVGLLYAFYRTRINQLRKQEQIRREIASDLHDDIGSTLNSVKVYAHLVEAASDKQQYIDQIKESLKQASTGLRDMIWVLDDSQDTLEELVNRIKRFALPLASASGIHINFSLGEINNLKLKKTEKRNLLLITKESINNCIKYAACKKINITFQKINGKLSLNIEDDGSGFNHNETNMGNGLKNIKERARQINYKMTISSEKGYGTKIYMIKV